MNVNGPSFDLLKFVPQRYIKEIAIKTITVGSRVASSTRKLNRHIILDEEICWLIGFFMAEGDKCDYAIGATNCEPQLVEKFRDILEKRFLLSKPPWSLFVTTSGDTERNRETWSRRFGDAKVTVHKNALTRSDALELRFNNRPVALLFNSFIEAAADAISVEARLAVPFLKGYAIGDGSVIQRGGYLYGIAITVKNAQYKNLLVRAVETAYKRQPRVRITKGCFELSLTGVGLMNRLVVDGWFEEVPRQRIKLIRSFLLKEYTRSHIRYWKELNGKSLHVSELAVAADRSHWSVRDTMQRDASLGIVAVKRGRLPGIAGPYHVFYELTDQGKVLLEKLVGCDKM